MDEGNRAKQLMNEINISIQKSGLAICTVTDILNYIKSSFDRSTAFTDCEIIDGEIRRKEGD